MQMMCLGTSQFSSHLSWRNTRSDLVRLISAAFSIQKLNYIVLVHILSPEKPLCSCSLLHFFAACKSSAPTRLLIFSLPVPGSLRCPFCPALRVSSRLRVRWAIPFRNGSGRENSGVCAKKND